MAEYMKDIYDGVNVKDIWRSICEGYMADYIKDIYGGEYVKDLWQSI